VGLEDRPFATGSRPWPLNFICSRRLDFGGGKGGGFLGHDTRGIERIDGQGDGDGGCSGLGTGPRDGEPPRAGHNFLNQMA
jgi:hypothetical protein